MSEQLDALRAMSARSEVLRLTQLGLEKRDWEELPTMGGSAKMEESKGCDLAARIERWNAVANFCERVLRPRACVLGPGLLFGGARGVVPFG